MPRRIFESFESMGLVRGKLKKVSKTARKAVRKPSLMPKFQEIVKKRRKRPSVKTR